MKSNLVLWVSYCLTFVIANSKPIPVPRKNGRLHLSSILKDQNKKHKKIKYIPPSKSLPLKNVPFSRTLSHYVTQQTPLEPTKAQSYIWEDIAPIPFDELIISWNAKRPAKGYISFWTSVQYGSKWSPWHRMTLWGANRQRSFINKLHQHVHTKHVRVELQRNQSATAFRVKAVAHEGATLDNLHAIFACCSYHQHFKAAPTIINYPSYRIKGIPSISQMKLNHERHQDLCAPTSLSMVTSHFNQKFLSEMITSKRKIYNYAINFADKVHDHGIDIFGNWQFNAAQAYEACKGQVFFRVERLNSFDDLYSVLRRDIPVIVSVRRLKGGATPYTHGHILVVIGWNQEKKSIICLDPAFKKRIMREYPIHHFSQAWALSKNLSFIPIPKKK